VADTPVKSAIDNTPVVIEPTEEVAD